MVYIINYIFENFFDIFIENPTKMKYTIALIVKEIKKLVVILFTIMKAIIAGKLIISARIVLAP